MPSGATIDVPHAAGARGAAAGGCWAVCRCDPGYPPQLFDLDNRVPAVLFGAGEESVLPRLDREATVTIVGSRRATPYGLGIARELGHLLASAGLVVVSGMAFGIDSAAHEGALEGGGTTVAVLGGGADVVYPAAKRRLYQRILSSGGAAISERPPGTTPERWAFPARNRIMAAIAGMTVVVEGAEPSGSLITAEEVVRLDRSLGAVPGPVSSRTSAGPHALIRDGAYEGLSYKRRRELHGRVAEVIEQREGDHAEESAELLSLHFHRAGRWPETWRYSVAAAHRAEEKYANVETVQFLERALDAAKQWREAPPEEVARVWEFLGDVRMRIAAYEEAGAAYREARVFWRSDPVQEARLMQQEAIVPHRLGKYPQALRRLTQALRVLEGIEGEAVAAQRHLLEDHPPREPLPRRCAARAPQGAATARACRAGRRDTTRAYG